MLALDDTEYSPSVLTPFWSSDMLVRPRDLANRVANEQQPETFTMPLEAARCKARQIINGAPLRGFTPVIERWRQLPDGWVELSVRHYPAAD
jgi:hypothetical protein